LESSDANAHPNRIEWVLVISCDPGAQVQFCWSQTNGQTQVARILHRPGRASGAITVFNFLVHFINKKRKTGIFR